MDYYDNQIGTAVLKPSKGKKYCYFDKEDNKAYVVTIRSWERYGLKQNGETIFRAVINLDKGHLLEFRKVFLEELSLIAQ